MTKETVDVNISIEKTIHTALRDILQSIWDEHQIRVDAIDVSWRNESTSGKRIMRTQYLQIDSTTFPE